MAEPSPQSLDSVNEPGAAPVAAEVPTAGRTPWYRLADPVFVAILAVAALLRFFDLDWDRDFHLHPDERFLTMVGNATKLPSSLGQYLDQASSPMNPANAGNGFQFYVYGTLPVTVNKFLAVWLHNDTYNNYTLQGRVLSGIADLLVIVLLWAILGLIERPLKLAPIVKYLAVSFYAVAVLAIQLSHFFTVDTFLNLFMIASFYFSLRTAFGDRTTNSLVAGMCFGLAVACKTSAVYILPLDAWLVIAPVLLPNSPFAVAGAREDPKANLPAWRGASWNAFLQLVVFGLASYVALRLADPYMFQNPSLLDPRPSRLFLDNLKQLESYNNPDVWFPPAVQWIHKPAVIFALINLAVFGLGLALFLFVAAGYFVVVRDRAYRFLWVIALWTGGFFLYQSVQFSKNMRYFIFIYPFLCLFAAIGFEAMTRRTGQLMKAGLVAAVLVWPAAFMGMYAQTPARVAASDWLYQHAANNGLILSESWDDALPLPVAQTYNKQFRGEQLPVFDPDSSPEKWPKMNRLLKRGNFYVLSSNRGWGSIPTVPERYPRMTRFYRDLFANKTQYKQVAVFTSYPSLGYLGIPIEFPDQWAEESFTVYDHPKVMIFERSG